MDTEIQDQLAEVRPIPTDSPEFEELCESLRNCSTWQLICKLNAERAEHARQMAALRKWHAGGRKGLLAPELKAKWLELVLEHDGVEAAAREMDRLATNKMPEALE